MSTFNTDVMTGQASPNAASRVQGNLLSGQVAFVDALYTTRGTEVGGDAIAIAILPDGAVLQPDLCRVSTEGCGTSVSVATLGDSADMDRYAATAVNVATAVTAAFTPTPAIMHTPYVITTATSTILAYLTTTPSATKKLRFRLAYLMP